MISLNVLAINDDTAQADATYAIPERSVYRAYVDRSDTGKTFVEIEKQGSTQRLKLRVNDTIANVLTALNAGSLLKIFISLTVKDIDGFDLPSDTTHLLNMKNMVSAYDYASDGYIEYCGINDAYPKLYHVDQTISTITAAAADISAGAETLVYPFTSKTVYEINETPLITPRVTLLNEEMITNVIKDFKNSINSTALGTVKLKLETVISITAAGTGYTALDVLTLVGGTGTAATIRVDTVGGGGNITGVTLLTAGSYITLPGAIAAVAVTGGTGTGATFSVDFEVDSIVITDAGSGYTAAPTVTISGGGGAGATATSTLNTGKVISTTITAPGNNFTSIPTVAFAAPTAKTAWEIQSPNGGQGKVYVF